INLVTRKPKFERGGEITMRAGSYDFYKPSLDVYGAVGNSEHVAYRINTTYEKAGSFRDHVSSERFYINPSFLVNAGSRTQVLVEGDYLNDVRTLDYGIGAINYTIHDVPRDRFVGAVWSYNNANQRSASVTVTHELSDHWKVNVVGGFQNYTNDLYGTARPNASGRMVSEDGTWVRSLQRREVDEDYYLAQVDLNGTFNTGALKHKLLAGADRDAYNTDNLTFSIRTNPQDLSNTVYDTINIFDLSLYEQRKDIPQADVTSIATNYTRRVGVYVQDLVELTEKLKLLAGIRYSYIEIENETFKVSDGSTTTGAATYADAFSPRLGIVYQPLKSLSLFASYTNNFETNSGTDNRGEALAPSVIDQYEVGVKKDFLKGLLSANVTAYKIVNSNLAQTILSGSPDFNPEFPNARELAGEVTSNGVELDLMSKPVQGLSLIAGYSYNDTRYTKSTQYVEGSRLRYNPQHTANTSVFYTLQRGVLRGVEAGFTAHYVGDRVAGRSTQVNVPNDTRRLIPVPDYFQFDASVAYGWTSLSVRIKVSNLLNELSYYVHDDNSVNPLAPRMLSATVGYKFSCTQSTGLTPGYVPANNLLELLWTDHFYFSVFDLNETLVFEIRQHADHRLRGGAYQFCKVLARYVHRGLFVFYMPYLQQRFCGSLAHRVVCKV
ncbi:MAG: TonB-dependent siderophore receptor, partial [Bacteroidia bacterium]|nr:TonB-dependent siderophore receptor [Bacteroidia bacterium]